MDRVPGRSRTRPARARRTGGRIVVHRAVTAAAAGSVRSTGRPGSATDAAGDTARHARAGAAARDAGRTGSAEPESGEPGEPEPRNGHNALNAGHLRTVRRRAPAAARGTAQPVDWQNAIVSGHRLVHLLA